MRTSSSYTLNTTRLATNTKDQLDRPKYDTIMSVKLARLHSVSQSQKPQSQSQQKNDVGSNGQLYTIRTTGHTSARQQGNDLSNPVSVSQHDTKSTDWQLVERVQHGDKKAFDLLVLKYQGKVASLVSRYIIDRHEVLDVTQESFIKAYRALKNFRGESAFYTWLYRISINTAKNHLVAKGRRPPGVDIDVQDAEHFSGDNNLKDIQSPERNLYRSELELALNTAISQLPEDLRVALMLREFDGLSYDEIAEVMECPVGTVRSRIFRARDAVDSKLAPYLDH